VRAACEVGFETAAGGVRERVLKVVGDQLNRLLAGKVPAGVDGRSLAQGDGPAFPHRVCAPG
jgi:hypothetical protein